MYIKDKECIEENDKFIYTEDIYLIYPYRVILFRSKLYSSDKPIKIKNSGVYNEKYKCRVQRFLELSAAPKEYLINHGYKPKL